MERIIRSLLHKKGTNEGIMGDILKARLYVIKEEFMRLINESLQKSVFEGMKNVYSNIDTQNRNTKGSK